tara:strand:- start:238 stop:579 length:342 start_codon:yes stop_codon:yes gene_type:complete
MSQMSIKGKVKTITEVEEKGNFRVRKLIIQTMDKYPQVVALDFTQNNVGLLDDPACKVGNNVEVFYNVRGRAWENREGKTLYFTSLQGWRVREYREEVAVEAQSPDREDDLPF